MSTVIDIDIDLAKINPIFKKSRGNVSLVLKEDFQMYVNQEGKEDFKIPLDSLDINSNPQLMAFMLSVKKLKSFLEQDLILTEMGDNFTLSFGSNTFKHYFKEDFLYNNKKVINLKNGFEINSEVSNSSLDIYLQSNGIKFDLIKIDLFEVVDIVYRDNFISTLGTKQDIHEIFKESIDTISITIFDFLFKRFI